MRVKVRNDQVILNSPVVVFTWEPVADGLAKHVWSPGRPTAIALSISRAC